MNGVSELKSELNRLESQLKDILHKNETIRGEISFVSSSIDKANSDLENYNKKVTEELDRSKDALKNSQDMMLSSFELQLEIENIYHSFKNIEDANKKIRAIQDDLFYSFNDYRMVRKVGLALIDSFDVGVVDDEVLEKNIEKKQLKSPDYWLTAACVAILFWKKDNKGKANKALKTALDLDEKNTCIFFMIFNLMMEREEAASLWFDHYQKCLIQSSDDETFLMLLSLIDKKVTEDGRPINGEISAFVKKQLKNKESKNSVGEMTNYVTNYFDHLEVPETLYYKNLSTYCLEAEELAFILGKAKTNGVILEFINKINGFSVNEKNAYLKNYLENLINLPSEKEKDKYEEIKYYEEVINLKGDINQAKVNYDKKQKHNKEPLNLVSDMVSWIYEGKEKKINSLTIWNMFVLTKNIQVDAANQFFESYRTKVSSNRNCRINDYEAKIDLENFEREDSRLLGFYDKKQSKLLRKVTLIPIFITIILMGLGIGAGIYLSNQKIDYFYLGYIASGVFLLILFLEVLLFIKKRNRIKLKIKKETDEASNILYDLCKDYEQYQRDYEVNDAISEDVIDALEAL